MDEFWLEESSQGSFEAFNDFMRGEPGPYFTPRVDANGNLIWTNNGDLPNPETVNIKGPKGNTGNNGQDGKSAYQAAVEGGYRGSEGSFNDYMANFPSMASAARTAASQASAAAGQAAASAAHASDLVDTLPDDYEDLLQDTTKTMQAVEALTVGPIAIASFDASAADMPLKGLTVDIEPVQAGSGDPSPDNVRPISGWTGCNVARTGKNLVSKLSAGRTHNSVTYTVKPDSGIQAVCTSTSHTKSYYTTTATAQTFSLNPGTYTLSASIQSAGVSLYVSFLPTGRSGYVTSSIDRQTFTLTEITDVFISVSVEANSVVDETIYPMLVFGTTATVYEPYQGDTYNITFPDGTVYGGTLDVVNGVLKVTHAITTVSAKTWRYESNYTRFNAGFAGIVVGKYATRKVPFMCSAFQSIDDGRSLTNVPNNSIYGAGTSATVFIKTDTVSTVEDFVSTYGNAQILYELAEPLVYDITDIPNVLTLLGTNSIWADCGDVTVTYGAYLDAVKAYADQVGDSILSAIAPLEMDYTASRAYSAGEFLFVGTKFYKVTAAIAEGSTITPGTNVIQTTVAEQLMSLTLDITGQPTDIAAAVGDSIEFAVTVSGGRSPYSYQWYYRNPGTTGYIWKASSNKTSTYSMTVTNKQTEGYCVYCVVTDANGATVTSHIAQVIVPT